MAVLEAVITCAWILYWMNVINNKVRDEQCDGSRSSANVYMMQRREAKRMERELRVWSSVSKDGVAIVKLDSVSPQGGETTPLPGRDGGELNSRERIDRCLGSMATETGGVRCIPGIVDVWIYEMREGVDLAPPDSGQETGR